MNQNTVFATLQQSLVSIRDLFMRRQGSDGGKDINAECGYPDVIATDDYYRLYKRELGKRVVNFLPEETWKHRAIIYEDENPSSFTAFEKAWEEVEKKHQLVNKMKLVDKLSGVGRFGILLLGIDDEDDLQKPIASVEAEAQGSAVTEAQATRKLLWVRAFQEKSVKIKAFDTDPKSPRYALPVLYQVQFESTGADDASKAQSLSSVLVHWTRVIHVADNKEDSLVLGTPRMEVVYNRLVDLRKIMGGAGEMFWKGGFPGFSFEVNPEFLQSGAQVDPEKMRAEFYKYSQGLQRYLALSGVTAKTLNVQVADPTAHMNANLKLIAFCLGVPWRVFVGSEEARLASTEDKETWNARVAERQNDYATVEIIEPVINRLIEAHVLPSPSQEKGFTVQWPDLNTVTDKDKAEVADKRTSALAKYVAGNVDELIPPAEYLHLVLGFSQEETEQILKAADAFTRDEDDGASDEETQEEQEEETAV